jgi:hypothetical protein
VTATSVAVMIAAPRGTIATSVPAPVERNATHVHPVARAPSVERPNLAIVEKRATATTIVSAVLVMSGAPVVTVTAEQQTAVFATTVAATTASRATTAGETALTARPVAATTVRARTAHAMTAVPQLAPIVTSVAVTRVAPRA